MKRNRLLVACLSLGLITATFAAYWTVRHHQFVLYDDNEYITDNPIVKDGLSWSGVAWAFTAMEVANWHPLTWLSHMLDCQLWPESPGTHHLTNVLFHAANAVLVLLVLRRMTGSTWRSALVAALFALHPLHVESVAWVSERKDVLSTFFGLLAIWAYAAYAARPNVKRCAATACLFALSLMAKPMLVTLPLVLLLLDFWPLQRGFWILDFGLWIGRGQRSAPFNPKSKIQNPKLTWLFLEKLPLLALSGLSSTLTMIAQRRGGAVSELTELALPDRLTNAVVAYAQYIMDMFWPVNLVATYPHPGRWPAAAVLAAALLLLGVSAAAVALARRHRFLITGWLWYLGTLVPVIGLVQVGEQWRADRYTYVPLIGLFIMIAWSLPGGSATINAQTPGAHNSAPTPAHWLVPIYSLVAAVLLSALAIMTSIQAGYWADSITLFERTLRISPKNPTAHNNLGMALTAQGRTDDAVTHFRQAMELDPRYVDPCINMANTLSMQGGLDEAIACYDALLKEHPDHASAHNNIAAAYARQGKFDLALEHFRTALKLKPDFRNIHYNLGMALAGQNKLDEAIVEYREALRADAQNTAVHEMLGLALVMQGKHRAAIEPYRRLIALAPDNPSAYNNLARLLLAVADRGAGEALEAVGLAQRACELSGGHPQMLDTLAAAYAATGQLPKAVQTAQIALQRASAGGDQALADEIRTHLNQYETQAGGGAGRH